MFMNIEKIVAFLNSAIKKILDKPLNSSNVREVSYAFEFALILVGERVNEVIKEIQKFITSKSDLYTSLLLQQDIKFEAKETDSEELFRRLLRSCPIGESLWRLNALRSNLKHKFKLILDEHHTKFRTFNNQSPLIKDFLDEIRKVFRSSQDNNEIVKKLFSSSNIQLPDFSSIDSVQAVFDNKKSKNKHLTLEQQKNKVLSRLNNIREIAVFLATFSKKLETESQGEKKDITPLYATAMCLTVIGENATVLIQIKKNEMIELSIRNLLKSKPFIDILNSFSGVATQLTHTAESLPEFLKLARTAKKFLEQTPKLETLHTDITNLVFTLNLDNSEKSTIFPQDNPSIVKSEASSSSLTFFQTPEIKSERKRKLENKANQETDEPTKADDEAEPKSKRLKE